EADIVKGTKLPVSHCFAHGLRRVLYDGDPRVSNQFAQRRHIGWTAEQMGGNNGKKPFSRTQGVASRMSDSDRRIASLPCRISVGLWRRCFGQHGGQLREVKIEAIRVQVT